MKLIIQIPCYNEEGQLAATLGQLPRQIDGFDAVEWLIIDDGSTDRTIEVARGLGVEHIVHLTNNKGLAAAFQAGVFDEALGLLATAGVTPLDEFQRARVDLVRGHIAFASGLYSDAPPLLLNAARRLERFDPISEAWAL